MINNNIQNNLFLDFLPDQFFILDETFRIKYCNIAARKICSFNSDFESDKEAKIFYKIFPNSENLCTMLKKKEVLSSINNYELITPVNEVKKSFCLITAVVYENSADQKRQYAVFLKDMTESIKEYSGQIQLNMELITLNEVLKKNQTQIIMQDKLASIGQLSAGVAHEINNPLSYVYSNTDTLCSYMADIEKMYAVLKKLFAVENNDVEKISSIISDLKAADREINPEYLFRDTGEIRKESLEGIVKIKKIINSLVSFAQKNVLKKHDLLDVNKSIEEMLEITRNEYRHTIEINFEKETISDIYCIPAEINQSLLNIFINAIEAVNKKASVNDNHKGIINLKTFEKNNRVFVTITDNGSGIPENNIKRIFDPFFTTKRIGEGIGIGLTIAHDIIVNSHQGILDVQSSEDGTVITVALPCIEFLEERQDET